jgi:hypothetical protein
MVENMVGSSGVGDNGRDQTAWYCTDAKNSA